MPKLLKMPTGVYQIHNLINDKVYVGSAAVSLVRRFRRRHTEETKKKMSLVQKEIGAKGRSEEHFQNLKLAQRRRYRLKPRNQIQRLKVSQSLKRAYAEGRR